MEKSAQRGLRRQLWIDQSLQGTVVCRIALYWSSCIAFITLALAWAVAAEAGCELRLEHLGSVWEQHWPLYVALFFLVPLTMWDALRLSHRVAGPVLRVRQQLVRINQGEPFSELDFREDDFWHDLASQVNQLAKKTLS